MTREEYHEEVQMQMDADAEPVMAKWLLNWLGSWIVILATAWFWIWVYGTHFNNGKTPEEWRAIAAAELAQEERQRK